jgi:hypothetical protein
MSKFDEDDTVVVFYHNDSTGRPHEKQLQVKEVLDDGYLLEKMLDSNEYRYFDSGEFRMESTTLSTDASLSEPN